MKTLVIVPTFNEAENIASLLPALLSVNPALHVLVVDDHSPDGTGRLVDGIAQAEPRVHALHREGKQGLATAYMSGFRYALDRDFDCVVQMDADFSHRPEDLPALLESAHSADVVIGSRNVPGGRVVGWSLTRNIISKCGSFFARTLLGLPIRDCTGGFKCFSRRALSALDMSKLRARGYGFQVEVNFALAYAGMRFVEVPIVFPDRQRGQSKMSARIVIEAAKVVLNLRLGLSEPATVSGAAKRERSKADWAKPLEGER